MTLRQREWIILIRPYYLDLKGHKMPYVNVPKAMRIADFNEGTGTDTPVNLRGVGEGGTDHSPINEGGWVEWYRTTSFIRLRENYKEILKIFGKEYTQIMEVVPVDTIVTPLS